MRGLDCSGLLFEATLGATPRNSSQLVLFGKSISLNYLQDTLRPLDMIVYPGHVLFVRDRNTIIESKSPFGVRTVPIGERMQELLESRSLVNNWSPETPPKSLIIRRINFL